MFIDKVTFKSSFEKWCNLKQSVKTFVNLCNVFNVM